MIDLTTLAHHQGESPFSRNSTYFPFSDVMINVSDLVKQYALAFFRVVAPRQGERELPVSLLMWN